MTEPEPTTALMFDRFGDVADLTLRRFPAVPLGPEQVRVRITVAGLNPVDWQIVESESLAADFGVTVPAGFGHDFAGVIAEVGTSVTRWRVGDRVFGGARAAAVADSVVLDQWHRSLHATPAAVSDLSAGVLSIAGRTASAVADALAPRQGETVLVGAAGGGVGTILTQLLVRAGVRVIGTGSASSAEYLGSLGAEPIEYGPALVETLRSAKQPIDAAADLHALETAAAALELGVPAGRIVTIEADAPPAGVIAVNGSDARPDALEHLLGLIAGKELHIPIAAVYELDQFAAAIAQQRDRHVHGKIAIRLGALSGPAADSVLS